MGSGFGEGENRAQEAAQEAISSPLLDSVTIGGAQGVLLNITGGMDLAIDEVTHISTLIQEEAGEDAEIIFGVVHDPALKGMVRVTVIATGFKSGEEEDVIRPDFRGATRQRNQYQSQRHQQPKLKIQPGAQSAPRAAAVTNGGGVRPLELVPERLVTRGQIGELDIPTFIRRQMD
jgi:cell division protein FtsZ